MKGIKNIRQGFTLLELLVVVLIIGILASIALPQYQSSVRKARVAEAKITLRALVDATDRYILQHGDSNWDSLEDLDVQVPEETNNWEIYIDDCGCGPENGLCGCISNAEPKWESDYFLIYNSVNYGGGGEVYNGKFECNAKNDNGKKICKQLGGVIEYDNDDSFYIL